MVLAADHFLNDYPNDIEVSKFTNSSRLFAFFRDFDKHLNYVVNLISLVNVNQLTHILVDKLSSQNVENSPPCAFKKEGRNYCAIWHL